MFTVLIFFPNVSTFSLSKSYVFYGVTFLLISMKFANIYKIFGFLLNKSISYYQFTFSNINTNIYAK